MKLTYIHNCRMPTEKAHGYQIAKMCEAFANNGVSVKLIIPARHNHIKDDIFLYYHTKNNFTVHYVKFFDFLSWRWLNQKITFVLNVLEFLLLSLFLKIDKQNIIYTRSPEIAWLFGIRGYKTFFECHQLPEKRSKLFNLLIKKCGGITTSSHGMKADLLQQINDLPEDNILVAPNGIDPDVFLNNSVDKSTARSILNIPASQNVILYTGHLYSWKGVDVLAEAASLLSDSAVIYFVGGTDQDRINFTNKYQENNIVTISFQDRDKIALWLKAADILVLPNIPNNALSERHTSPIKMFEYMASGTSILASNLPSLKEILTDEDAYFFQAGDARSLSQALTKLLISSELRQSLAAQAKIKAKHFTWSNRAQKINDYLVNSYEK